MTLGRIVLLVEGDKKLLISRRWLSGIFVGGDIVSLLAQSAGGALMGINESMRKTGSNIVVAGLFIQIIFFGAFVAVASVFHYRIRSAPTSKMLSETLPYSKHLLTLYVMSGLIFVRSIVRAVEFLQGFEGYIISHEVFLYVFDAVPMVVVMLVLNWFHPSEIGSYLRGGKLFKGIQLVEGSAVRQSV